MALGNTSKNHALWRQRDIRLKDENTPPWKAAAFHRENVDQLFREWIEEELPLDAFTHSMTEECRKYATIIDAEDKNKSMDVHSELLESMLPDFKNKAEKFTSTLTSEKLFAMDCVKSALEQSQNINKAIQNELDIIGDIVLPPPPQDPPVTHPSKNPIAEQSSSSNRDTIFPDTSSIKTKQYTFKQSNEVQKQISIYKNQPMTRARGASPEVEHGHKMDAEPKMTLKTKRKYEEDEGEPERTEKKFHFKSAREKLEVDQKKKKGSSAQATIAKKSLGARPRTGCFGKFVPPSLKDQREENERESASRRPGASDDMEDIDPRLKNIDSKLIDLVTNEIMDHGPPVQWDDIAGLEFAKTTIKEIVIWPMLRPDIFTGLRGPPKGILLFGPPGTGKTLIGKCIASQSGATFFSISASSLTSKWVGEGEKMVRALFAVASCHQPAVIFIDEIDSLLTQRSDGEHESSRRIKTEFLVQLDGASTSSEERILVVGATNRPQEIDEAARRRLSKRLYIPLPEAKARKQIVESLLNQQSCTLGDEELEKIISETDGYSGADMANLCREAALGPIRSLQGMDISAISKDDVRPINAEDFGKALSRVRPSVSKNDLAVYEEWNRTFGCCSF